MAVVADPVGHLCDNGKKKERESENRRASDGARWLSCHEEGREREREREIRVPVFHSMLRNKINL